MQLGQLLRQLPQLLKRSDHQGKACGKLDFFSFSMCKVLDNAAFARMHALMIRNQMCRARKLMRCLGDTCDNRQIDTSKQHYICLFCLFCSPLNGCIQAALRFSCCLNSLLCQSVHLIRQLLGPLLRRLPSSLKNTIVCQAIYTVLTTLPFTKPQMGAIMAA